MSVNTAKGTALSRLTIHRPAMIRTGRCRPDIVYRCSGWQMARKRSIENATIVSTDTYVDASDISARILQNASPRLYGYWCQYRLISYGRPVKGNNFFICSEIWCFHSLNQGNGNRDKDAKRQKD